MNKPLKKQFTPRMASMADLPAIHQLDEKRSLHYLGTPGFSLARLQNEYQLPGFDPGQSVKLLEDQDGHLVGLAEVWDETDPPVHPFIWVVVDPDLEDRGLESYLLEWAEQRAKLALDRVSPDLRVAMRTLINVEEATARRALQAAGFEPIRHSFRMRIEMDQAPPQPNWPSGVHLRSYQPEQDARVVFETDDEVFQDHFGYVKEDPEEGFERFMHHMTGDESYDPSLWFLAADEEDRVVAICLCRRFSPEEKDVGYISSLGVKRAWRRKGIAQALLYQAFGEFYRRGKRKVDLGVDAESLTGATQLYEKVGMRVLRQNEMYEKELRPGEEISVTSLESEQAGE